MTPSRSSHEIYDQLMDINEEAFEQGYYEVAYHALAAALHSGLLLEEQGVLEELEQRTLEQRNWIDTYDSEHPLSSQSASSRGHVDVYTSLLLQIQTRKLMQQTAHLHPDIPS
jgi:hypothetical protein